jgi:hypothetical protein
MVLKGLLITWRIAIIELILATDKFSSKILMARSTWAKFGLDIQCVLVSVTSPLFDIFYQVFPDWFANDTQQWWTDALKNWTESGVQFSGIWLDMNEASSFCDGSWYGLSCGCFSFCLSYHQ